MTTQRSCSRSLATLWLRWYTAGLRPQLRDDRRAEILSDLAEHSSHRAADGWTGARIARERLARTLFGAPADVLWRREVLLIGRLAHSGGPLRAAWSWTRWEWPTLAGLALV